MPLLLVRMLEGRPPEKIEELIAELTATTARVLEAPPETVRVLVDEVRKTHWGIGGQSAASRGR